MSLGTLVIDEIILPIDRIALEDGMVVFYASRQIDATVMEQSDVGVFDPDGKMVLHVPSLSRGQILQSSGGGWMYCRLPMIVDEARR